MARTHRATFDIFEEEECEKTLEVVRMCGRRWSRRWMSDLRTLLFVRWDRSAEGQ
jgi:hypothetical protein